MLTYRELLARTDAPPGSAWGLFGPADELGTLNFLTPERVRAAAGCVRRGAVFNLDCAINAFVGWTGRRPAQHTVVELGPHARDDYLDGLFLHGTSHLDALFHFRHPEYGFYNGARGETLAPGASLGIGTFAEAGIVGRGVLVDLERDLAGRGKRLDYGTNDAFSVDVVEDAARRQGVEFRPGDILLLRTGWLGFYFGLTDEERRLLGSDLRCPGLVQAHESLAWIWDHQLALVAADNPGVEAVPAVASSPFGGEDFLAGLMHPNLLALLGVALGELWNLDALAEDCARDGVYEAMVVVKPLNLVGGTGSPANAVAIK